MARIMLASGALVFLGLVLAMAASGEPAFIPLGDLSGGLYESKAYDVSADGSVVVGRSRSSGIGLADGYEAFRWSLDGGMIGLGPPGGQFSQATSVSADGSVIVGKAYDYAFAGPLRREWSISSEGSRD